MAPASNEEQFKFLISCIRYSNNGKVDFEEVAKECDIVSKGAAAKRYERMMKAHGIHQSQTAAADAMRMTPTPSRQKPSTAPTSGKKRKKDQTQDTDMNEDDDEVLPNIKGEGPNSGVKTEASCKKIKAEWPEEGVRNKRIKAEDVKEESKGKGYETKIVKEEKQDMEDASARTQTETKPNIGAAQPIEGVDDALLNDFLAFGAYNCLESGQQLEDAGAGARTGMDVGATSSNEQQHQGDIVIVD